MFWGLEYLEIVWDNFRGPRFGLFSLLGEILFWRAVVSTLVQRLGSTFQILPGRDEPVCRAFCIIFLLFYPSSAARVAAWVGRYCVTCDTGVVMFFSCGVLVVVMRARWVN